MKIYVSHSRNFNYQRDLYEPLKNSTLAAEHEFIFPYELSGAPFESKKLFESKGCDIVFAEVSLPSTGQGIELGWANTQHLPVIAFHKASAKISGSLGAVCKKIIAYENTVETAITLLKESIEEK